MYFGASLLMSFYSDKMFYTKVNFNKHALYYYFFGIITLAGCNQKPKELNQTKGAGSNQVFEQIDSIAYIYPVLALSLLEAEGKKNMDSLKLAYFHYYKGRIILLQKENYIQALPNLEKALELSEKFSLLELQVKIFQEMSVAYSRKRELQKALEVLNQAFDLAEKIKYKDISSLYIEAGWVIFELDPTNPKAKEYLKSAIEKHRDKTDSVFFAKAYHNQATIYLSENMTDSAMHMIEKIIPIFKNHKMNKLLCNAYNTLGAIYEKKEDKVNTLKYYKLSATIGDLNEVETAFIYANIGRYYQYVINDNANALNYYLKSLEKPGNPKNIYDILESIATIYEQKGQSKLALDYYKNSMERKKTDLEQNYKESLKRLEVEFDVKRNKHRMKELDLELKNQYMKTRQQRIFIFSMMVFIFMGLAMLLLFLRQKNLKQDYEKVMLEQQLLRSQMNPHFIFNAISVIQYLIKNNHNSQADKYLSKFSRLLRKSLENSTGQFAPIQDEVALLDDYLALQKLRFTDEFEYKIITYDGFADDEAMIPPMIIQPFVENCIEHGIRDTGRKGQIQISIARKEKTFVCVVDDNGRGINQSNRSSGNGKRSLSTIISQKRLKILEKKLKIESKIEVLDKMEAYGENGTQIILTLPLII